MKTNPLVSVIIPTHNRADKIVVAIRSVMNQTYDNIELIVVDDESEDNTMEVVKQFPQAVYYRIDHARQGTARNFGLRQSHGSLIASLDSDDQWYPDFITRCVEKIETHQLDFVFANWLQRLPDHTTRDFLPTYQALAPFLRREQNNWVSLSSGDLRYLYARGCPSPSSSMVIRRSSIVTGWSAGIYIADDWRLILEMVLNKECHAAIYTQQLWVKNGGPSNVYDGRAWNEVNHFLYVKDIKEFMDSFQHLLSKEEKKALTHLHQEGVLNMAFYNLFKKRNIIQSSKLLIRSIKLGRRHFLKILPRTMSVCFSMKMHTSRTAKSTLSIIETT